MQRSIRRHELETVTSLDGTEIAFQKSGQGPAVIIVGGALADHRFYAPLAAELATQFTVYNFDRRGRGQSGDSRPYAVEREVEDVAALIDRAAERAFVYGHSAGSALAIRAAADGLDIGKLVLADPPFTPRGDDDEAAKAEFADEAARIDELHSQGDIEGCAAVFLAGMGLSRDEVEEFLQGPGGERIVDSARALPRDYAVVGDGIVPDDLAARVTVPTLVLAAGAMPETGKALADAIPNARFHAMEASAHETPPAAMAERLTRFFGR